MSVNRSNIVYGCVTHVPIDIQYPDFVQPIYLGDIQDKVVSKDQRFGLRNLASEWNDYHPVLGGSAGSFALKNYILNSRPNAEYVGICQYRKFVSANVIGVNLQNYAVMCAVNKNNANVQALEDQMLPRSSDFLVGQPGSFPYRGETIGYLDQYAGVHHVQDILRFVANAVDLGVLEDVEVSKLFDEKIFFPGGIELGVFPIEFWIKHITAIEDVVRVSLQQFPHQRDGYQVRSWAFCAERLGSYFLLREAKKSTNVLKWIDQNCGHLNLFTEDLSYTPGF